MTSPLYREEEKDYDPVHLVAMLRKEVESLASRLAVLSPPPYPDELIQTPGLRGPMWNAIDTRDPRFVYPWRVRAIDDEPGSFVYVHHPRTFDPNDFETVTVDEARRLAYALLAACDYVTATPLTQRRIQKSVETSS